MSDRPDTRVAADYGCYATWRRAPDGALVNVSPAELPVPETLQVALMRWAEVYDATLDREDPMNSGFATDLEHEMFASWGRALAELLALALDHDIEYFDDRSATYSVVR
jgi:hypothetical protein